jgi:hypothetical protein
MAMLSELLGFAKNTIIRGRMCNHHGVNANHEYKKLLLFASRRLYPVMESKKQRGPER